MKGIKINFEMMMIYEGSGYKISRYKQFALFNNNDDDDNGKF